MMYDDPLKFNPPKFFFSKRIISKSSGLKWPATFTPIKVKNCQIIMIMLGYHSI